MKDNRVGMGSELGNRLKEIRYGWYEVLDNISNSLIKTFGLDKNALPTNRAERFRRADVIAEYVHTMKQYITNLSPEEQQELYDECKAYKKEYQLTNEPKENLQKMQKEVGILDGELFDIMGKIFSFLKDKVEKKQDEKADQETANNLYSLFSNPYLYDTLGINSGMGYLPRQQKDYEQWEQYRQFQEKFTLFLGNLSLEEAEEALALFQKYNNSFDKDRNSEIIVGEEEKQTLQAYLKSNGFTEEECKKIVLGYNSFFKEIEKDIKKRKKQLEKQTKENEKFKNKYGLERSKLSPLEQKFVKQVFKLELIKLMELPHLLQLSESPNIYIRRYLGHKFDEREWEKINENLPCIKEIVNQILKQQEEKCLESDWNAGIIIAKDRAQERKKHIDSLQQNME